MSVFQVGDHHDRFQYEDESFDASYSFQALWPFIKPSQVDGVSQEIFRVLKPGAVYGCGEYLLAPAFDKVLPLPPSFLRLSSLEMKLVISFLFRDETSHIFPL